MERYQIGIENVQFMVSKWADAYMQLRAFVATEQATCSKEKAVRINQSRRAAAGRAELLANPAIMARIFAGSIQTPHGRTNYFD